MKDNWKNKYACECYKMKNTIMGHRENRMVTIVWIDETEC